MRNSSPIFKTWLSFEWKRKERFFISVCLESSRDGKRAVNVIDRDGNSPPPADNSGKSWNRGLHIFRSTSFRFWGENIQFSLQYIVYMLFYAYRVG